MSNEQDKYNDYDTDEVFANGISHSRRRRAAKRNAADVKAQHASKKPKRIIMQKSEPVQTKDGEAAAAVEEEKPTAVNTEQEGVIASDGKKHARVKKPMSLKRKFITIILAIVGVYIVAIGAYALTTYFSGDSEGDWTVTAPKPLEKITEVFSPKLPERTQFVVMCTDEDGTRTDTIMVGCYNSVTEGISLISVPRDTIVSVSAANYEVMRQEFPEPGQRTMKINAVHHYAGDDLGPEMLVDELNTLLGIDIQYYVRVDFDAFHYLIDSIGGVEFDVPQDMDYDDPTQDLSIHLKAGMQLLDGDKAEQLVRFRKDNYGGGYINGDLGRIEMQQEFMKVLIAKLTSVDTIKSNPTAYLTAFFKYIKTNAGISDAVKYASALDKIDTSKIETYTLPGYLGYASGISGYMPDQEAIDQLVYDIFERPVSEMISTEQTTVEGATEVTTEMADSREASIQVLNGGYTTGKAGDVRDTLTAEGYNISDIGDYSSTKQESTRIYVSESGLGTDLVSYFNDAEVIVDPSSADPYDIVVVIGTGE